MTQTDFVHDSVQILRSADRGTTYDTILTNQAFATKTHFDNNLTPATEYYYQVQAFYEQGSSELSVPDIACTC